jgi:homoserine kinase type II
VTATPQPTAGPDVEGDVAALAQVCSAFGLDSPYRVEVIVEGLMNRNWRVDTACGSYAVKQIRDVAVEQARFQHAATVRLAAAGVRVPAPLATRAGETVVVVGGQPYAVFPWVAGGHLRPLDWTGDQCTHVGDVLGRIHTVLRDVLPVDQLSMGTMVPEAAKVKGDIDRYLSLIDALPDRDAFDAFVVERLAERRALLERMVHLRPDDTVVLSPVGYTHGDFQDLNLLFDGGQVSAVVDWDRLGVRPWCYELARSATLMFGYGDGRALDLGRAAAFAAGYAAVTGVSGAQVTAATERLWWERVADFWQLKLHYVKHDSSCDHLFRSASALVAWWSEHRDAVSAALTSR